MACDIICKKKRLEKELKVNLPNRLIPSLCDSEGC